MPVGCRARLHTQSHPHSPHVRRLILFLQQSSVEWASSLWLNVVQEVDPSFQRTVRDCTGRGADLHSLQPLNAV